MKCLKTDTTTAYRLAWEARRAANEHKPPVDNAALPAGAPMYFRCPSCFGDIILPEGYLMKPAICYDCQELLAHRLIVSPLWPETAWKWARVVRDA